VFGLVALVLTLAAPVVPLSLPVHGCVTAGSGRVVCAVRPVSVLPRTPGGALLLRR
jgi:hypothetical protein